MQKVPGSFDEVEMIGNLLTYVDELKVMSSKEVTTAVIENINKVWTCSTPVGLRGELGEVLWIGIALEGQHSTGWAAFLYQGVGGSL